MRIADRYRFTRADLMQCAKYMIGGTSYFWTGYLVFAFCYSGLGWHWFPAKMAGDVIGWSVNYAVQRFWAFNTPGLGAHEGAVVGRYTLLTVGNLLLDYCIIGGLTTLGITPYVSFFISAGFFTIWNYAWYRFWVFYTKNRGARAKEAIV